MAGFFGLFDYTKEGPGVYANEPPKGPFRTFFAILGRKFWKIITINLMYLLFSLPAFAVTFLLAPTLVQMLIPGFTLEGLESFLKESLTGLTQEEIAATLNNLLLMGYVLFSMTCVGLSYIVVGPVLAGTTYLLRNYAREEHAFVWMDFKDSIRANWKQSGALSLISLVLLVVLVFDYRFFSAQESPIVQGLLSGVVLVLGLILSIMLMYLYPMLVTFKLTFRKMMRNALLLTLARFLPNLGILLLNVAVLFLLPLVVGFINVNAAALFAILWYALFAFGFTQFLNNFYVYRQFKKYMIRKDEEAPVAQAEPSAADGTAPADDIEAPKG